MVDVKYGSILWRCVIYIYLKYYLLKNSFIISVKLWMRYPPWHCQTSLYFLGHASNPGRHRMQIWVLEIDVDTQLCRDVLKCGPLQYCWYKNFSFVDGCSTAQGVWFSFIVEVVVWVGHPQFGISITESLFQYLVAFYLFDQHICSY